MIDKKGIVEYYDVAQVSYQDVWHLDDCLALHYGFWESGVTSLRQALVKENEVLAQLAGIQPGVFVKGHSLHKLKIILYTKF